MEYRQQCGIKISENSACIIRLRMDNAAMQTITEVREGWRAPGYRDPELHFKSEDGTVYHFKLTPRAFVELHNAVCSEQACIDRTGGDALDRLAYPIRTAYVAVPRR